MNYLDFFKIPKAQTGIKTHSPNINVGISIPFDRRPTFNFNVGDNIDTQSFRNPRASHSSNFNIGGYYSLDTGNGSVFGNYGRSFNNFPSITVSGSVPFSTKQMAPAKLTVPDSLDVNRRNTMLEFLKSKGKDPSRLSSNDVRDLTMMFQDGSGDDVLRRYDQLSGMFNKGGEIHIKKKNVGSFTQYCNGHVTEECIERGKHSSNPTTRKRATFAANARTWKHQEGGKTKKTFFTAVHPDFENEDLSGMANYEQLPRVVGITPDYMEPYNLPTIGGETTVTSNSTGTTVTLPTPTTKEEAKTMEKELRALAKLMGDKGVKVRITSLNRAGATTSNGRAGYHATGNAMDIVPVDGNFEALRTLIKTDPEIRAAFEELGVGVLDETTPEMLARTGGTGAHFHIGPDKAALATTQKWWSES